MEENASHEAGDPGLGPYSSLSSQRDGVWVRESPSPLSIQDAVSPSPLSRVTGANKVVTNGDESPPPAMQEELGNKFCWWNFVSERWIIEVPFGRLNGP